MTPKTFPNFSGHLDSTGHPHPQVDTADQLLLYVNASNLVARWQNIIVRAATGDEQLRWMRESGVFADDIALTFNLPDGTRLEFTGLDDQPQEFYASFVDGLTKVRNNLGANIEVLEYLVSGGLRFRFRYAIVMDEIFSLLGDNEAIMEQRDGRWTLTSANIDVRLFNTEHAY